ncbi:MAG TPA: aspartate kinase [Bryobacteraceae bacterium]|nr:aspartate kinase [Bryobacteraceae bacterium]
MTEGLLVMKFGGTSMGSAERICVAADICREQRSVRPVLAVVSAMSGVTDLLLNTLRHAEGGDEAHVEASVAQLLARHLDACRGLGIGERAGEGVRNLIADFERLANGMLMLGDRPARSVDEAIAIGERLTALMLAEHLSSKQIAAKSINGADVIVTDAVFGNATPIMDATRQKAQAIIKPLLDSGVIPVVTGFNGATVNGRPTTLGRGGSDFSASILAAALDAAELWIWTDVDGIMSADPRLVKDARVLDAVTYSEAAELAYNGAKVLHPRTLAPLVDRQIPVWSKNSFNRSHRGTRILSKVDAPPGPRAVTSMANVALISLEPASAAVSGTRLMARALEALADANAEVLALTSSSYRQSFCFLVRKEELPAAMKSLEADLALELTHGYLKPIDVDENVGLLAVVGEGMHGTQGLAGRIFSAISKEDVNIIAIAQGSSELTISVVVHRDGLERAIRAVHKECR